MESIVSRFVVDERRHTSALTYFFFLKIAQKPDTESYCLCVCVCVGKIHGAV